MDLTLSAFDFAMARDDGVEKLLLSSFLGVYSSIVLSSMGVSNAYGYERVHRPVGAHRSERAGCRKGVENMRTALPDGAAMLAGRRGLGEGAADV